VYLLNIVLHVCNLFYFLLKKQPIEAFWRIFREGGSQFWIDHFKVLQLVMPKKALTCDENKTSNSYLCFMLSLYFLVVAVSVFDSDMACYCEV